MSDPACIDKMGNYHCNNRVYSIGAGRWLSPDQAASPFFNLFDYLGNAVLQLTDPSGLEKNAKKAKDDKPTQEHEYDSEGERHLSELEAPELARIRLQSNIFWRIRRALAGLYGRKEKRSRSTAKVVLDKSDHDVVFDGAKEDHKVQPAGTAEFDAWLKERKNSGTCISELTISTHGDPWDLEGKWAFCSDSHKAGLEKGYMGATEWGQKIRPVMCRDKCVIKIDACNFGLGTGPQELANSTGCEVRAHSGYCHISLPFESGCKRTWAPYSPYRGATGQIVVFFPGNKPASEYKDE